MADLLTPEEIASSLLQIPGWKQEGKEITRTFPFPSYMAGIEFVTRVAHLAEAANHHPDITIHWSKVTLRLSTHSKGGLTVKDFTLAARADEAAAQ